ncbi:MAG: hypothetical protein AVDCRST_MAG53-1134 [uncultured Solirubrobacteraceae bacterium]|uniref:Uncharacterized protein n=1 Tax=uncultured Solirubrobacteraceae bacterium TaxID=1162706 RepID=A0A6J4S3A9_9ACTN|nr:MAG: hypothetical protein AVDCRST_MAG53-1134 [uncultured Solirubrobacteraceae bacterium]
MSQDVVRFDLGFNSGGTASGQATETEWQRVEEAFTRGDEAVVAVEVEGARMWIRVSQVAWARVHRRGSRVGF